MSASSHASCLEPVRTVTHRLNPIIVHDECVFDAHANAAIGEVESRLDRDDIAALDHVAASRLLVNVETDAVAESVNVAFERLRIRARGRIAERLEKIADEIVIVDRWHVRTHCVARSLERFEDVSVNATQLVGNFPDAERARHVEEVTRFTIDGKDVEDDRRRRLDNRVRIAARVRDGSVASLRQDRVVIFDHAAVRDAVAHDRFQVAEYGSTQRQKITRIALVRDAGTCAPDNLVENVSVNRGFNLKAFMDLAAAETWLRAES